MLGCSPRRDAARLLARVGFVAQEHPLYKGFTIAETLKLGRKLNATWDNAFALDRIEALGLQLDQKAGKLSGGQRAQVALTLALAKRPDLLLLDEPVASLDPLARREFLQSVMEAVAESGMTVVLSSHIVADLERACDHLVILSTARVQLAGEIEEIVAGHRVLTGTALGPCGRRARARGDPRAPHRAPDDAARAGQRPRLRLLLGAARGRSRGDSCSRTSATTAPASAGHRSSARLVAS